MKITEPGILVVALGLYMSGFGWAMSRGAESLIAGLLMGCGSIAMGVWLGITIAERRSVADTSTNTSPEITIGLPGTDDDEEPSI